MKDQELIITEQELTTIQGMKMFVGKSPKTENFKRTPDGKAFYLPIDFIENMLDQVFNLNWSTKNFRWERMGNEVVASLDLEVTMPFTNAIVSRVGAASVQIMVDSIPEEVKKGMSRQQINSHALDPQNKKPNALDMGFPKLKADCVKNAAISIGNLFGRNVNRTNADKSNYSGFQILNVIQNANKPIAD